MPVPGDGQYEWAGFYDMDELPVAANPERGWLATANEMNLPEGYPPERTITYDWYAGYRRERIGEVLDAQPRMSHEDMVALQADYVSIPARRIVRRLRELCAGDPRAAEGLALLGNWNADLRADSAAAALFEVWYRRHLRPALLSEALERLVPGERRESALRMTMPEEDLLADARVDVKLLEHPGDRFGPQPEAVIAEVMATSLATAVEDLERLLGRDHDRWAWGGLHRARLVHPLSGLLTGVPEEHTSVGPLPRGGSGDTVGNTAYTPDFAQSAGSTFRVVVDVGDWDRSLAMNSPGQSGDPRSSHYADLFEPWAENTAIPLLYSRASVEAALEHQITLKPG
jgi:penicillin amidase